MCPIREQSFGKKLFFGVDTTKKIVIIAVQKYNRTNHFYELNIILFYDTYANIISLYDIGRIKQFYCYYTTIRVIVEIIALPSLYVNFARWYNPLF